MHVATIPAVGRSGRSLGASQSPLNPAPVPTRKGTMKNIEWDFVYRLSTPQLCELHQLIIAILENRSHVASTQSGAPHESSTYNLAPPKTLGCSEVQHFRPTDPLSGPAWDVPTSSPSYPFERTPQLDQQALGHNITAQNSGWDGTSTLVPDSLSSRPSFESSSAADTPLHLQPSTEKDIIPSSTFFCTFCQEHGVVRTFKTKHDWKRHEKVFHETGSEWECRGQDCEEVFAREKDFRTHMARRHKQKHNLRGDRVSIPEGKIYACGFKPCRTLKDTWKERCNHVARCMFDSSTSRQWDYTWKILNLLRHPRIHPTWKQVKARWFSQPGLDASQLSWDPQSSRSMRLQLQCHNFDNLEDLLERLLKMGLLKHTGPQGFLPPTHRIHEFPYLPSPQVVGPGLSAEAYSPECSSHTQGAYGMVSYEDQRHPNFNNFEQVGAGYASSQKRGIITMQDVFAAAGEGDHQLPSEQNLMTVTDCLLSDFSTNKTPPLPSSSFSPTLALHSAHKASGRTPGNQQIHRTGFSLSPFQ